LHLRLLAVGTRMPDWVTAGYAEYARRLPREMPLELVEIPLGRRRGQSVERARADEAKRMLARLTPGGLTVALDETGRQVSTRELAERLGRWREQGRSLDFLVGGPDGLDDACRSRAEDVLALSRLTLPHGMVRVLLAEQLYRAWTVLSGHPYHRD
jgi:23S rRNA (pseudouridine1915-N3)-methyltransferase